MATSSTPHEEHNPMNLQQIFEERGLPGVVAALQVILPLLQEYLPQIIAYLQSHQQQSTKRGKDNG